MPGEFSDDGSWSDDDDNQEGIWTPETGPSDESIGYIDPEEVITESRDLHLSVNESITSLLRLSVQIHRSSRINKFAKSSRDTNYEVSHDISHVKDFFPHLDTTHNEALATRLGKANAQRRQWLWYRRRHREKLSVDLSASTGAKAHLPSYLTGNRRGTGADDETESIALSSADLQPSGSNLTPSVMSGTRASTFRSRITDESAITPSIGPANTLFGRSSRATASEQKLLIPEPPYDLVLDQPYACRYCCNVIEISGRYAWQYVRPHPQILRHV
jgi:hypothetical protein